MWIDIQLVDWAIRPKDRVVYFMNIQQNCATLWQQARINNDPPTHSVGGQTSDAVWRQSSSSFVITKLTHRCLAFVRRVSGTRSASAVRVSHRDVPTSSEPCLPSVQSRAVPSPPSQHPQWLWCRPPAAEYGLDISQLSLHQANTSSYQLNGHLPAAATSHLHEGIRDAESPTSTNANVLLCDAVTGKLSLSYARPAADGWPLVGKPSATRSANSAFHPLMQWAVIRCALSLWWCHLVNAYGVKAGCFTPFVDKRVGGR